MIPFIKLYYHITISIYS